MPGPHEFTLVSYTCLPRLSPTLGVLGRMILHLSPTCPHTCLPHFSSTLVSHNCLPHLSPTLGAFGRRSLHLSTTCLPHSGCLGPHEFTLVSTCLPHLSPTLVSHSGCLGPHEFTLVYAAQGTQSGRQVWETSVGGKCGIQTSVGDKSGT